MKTVVALGGEGIGVAYGPGLAPSGGSGDRRAHVESVHGSTLSALAHFRVG